MWSLPTTWWQRNWNDGIEIAHDKHTTFPWAIYDQAIRNPVGVIYYNLVMWRVLIRAGYPQFGVQCNSLLKGDKTSIFWWPCWSLNPWMHWSHPGVWVFPNHECTEYVPINVDPIITVISLWSMNEWQVVIAEWIYSERWKSTISEVFFYFLVRDP